MVGPHAGPRIEILPTTLLTSIMASGPTRARGLKYRYHHIVYLVTFHVGPHAGPRIEIHKYKHVYINVPMSGPTRARGLKLNLSKMLLMMLSRAPRGPED